MPRERRGCGICDSSNRTLLACSACINNVLLFEKRKVLGELNTKRAVLLARLNELIDQRAALEEHRARRQSAAVAAHEAKQRALDVERELEAAKAEVTRLRRLNIARKNKHELVSAQLAAQRADVLNNRMPTAIRYQSLHLSSDQSKLLREQRHKLGQLLEILPLRISALRSGGTSPIQVTICNLKLPDTLSASSLMVQQPEATSSALGYLVLFQDLVSTYLGGPVLHEGAFQGSTTVLWQQASFWNRRPADSNSRLPLFLEEPGPATLVPNPFPSLTKVRNSSSWAPPPLARALSDGRQLSPAASGSAGGPGGAGGSAGTGGGSSTGAGAGGERGTAQQHLDDLLVRQRYTDLKLATDLLQRSVACFVRDKVQQHSLQLPHSWSPYGWLVLLCAVLQRDERSGAVVAAATAMAADARSDQVLFMGDTDGQDEGEAVEEDGWDVVQAPFLPPPPSQPDEVEHWTRAMFTDARARGPTPMTLERVRSLFSK